mgnify:CR=1 FL=1|jgi:asparagine synthase (glutamine-hydrolysing)|tara:strand:- start:10874 stop:12604 length:1731 start_codon:yes stop_codon:yes gene_type:complete
MKPLRFMLAFPKGRETGSALLRVAEPQQVLGDAPAIWTDPTTPCLGLNDAGMLIGVAFSRETYEPLSPEDVRLSADASATLVANFLVRNVWGGYLAVIYEEASEAWYLLRDPSFLCPAYRLTLFDHFVIASDAAMLLHLPGYRPTIAYPSLARRLLDIQTRSRQTCLEDLTELAPGALQALDDPHDRGPAIWHPRNHYPKGPAPRFEDAAEELRWLCVSAMTSWSRLCGKVSVATSGGVDSSLVCAALSRADRDFACVTLATADPSGDERRYAREVAARSGVPLSERILRPGAFDPARTASAGMASPTRRSFLTVLDAVLSEEMEALEARLVFDGNGGDNLFCFLHSAAPIVDRWRAEGTSRQIVETLLDMCRVTGCSVPTMLRAAASRAIGASRGRARRYDRRFVAAGIAMDRGELLASWFDGANGSRTGKHDHLALLVSAANQIHGLTEGPPRFSPLSSQPLVEFCLGIPTWLWVEGGINRSLARAAFAEEIPASIRSRTSKAGPDSFVREAFALHKDAIRDRLLGGHLSEQGLLDLTSIEVSLKIDYTTSEEAHFDRLLDLLEIENWCRSWIN